jgi:hypothetical protein
VASLEMYFDGLFSDDPESPYQVTGKLAFNRQGHHLMYSGRPPGLDVGQIIDCVPSIPREPNVGAGRSLWAPIPPSGCFGD